MAKTRRTSEPTEDDFDWQLMLAGRNVPGAVVSPKMRLKLLPTNMISSYGESTAEVNVGEMSATVRISTPTLDLGGDVVVGSGIDTTIHKTNPLVLLMHQPTMPIGRSVDPQGNYTVSPGDHETLAKTYFFQSSPEAEQVFRLVEMKALPAVSAGIKPKRGKAKMRSLQDGTPYCLIEDCMLMEYSHVVFPENPETLVLAVQKGLGGKPMLESLREMFAPLLPPKTVWSPGATLPEKTPMTKPAEKPRRKEAAPMPTETDEKDERPHGAQFMAALHEMLTATLEFAEQGMGSLEPEVAEHMEDFFAGHTATLDGIAAKYADRYPDLPELGKSADDEPAEEPKDDEPEPKEPNPDEPKPDDDKEKSLKFRSLARGHVRRWWGERMKKLSQAELIIAKQAADFLSACARSSRVNRVSANQHSAALRGLLAKSVKTEPKTDPEPDPWAGISEALDKREKALSDRLTKLTA